MQTGTESTATTTVTTATTAKTVGSGSLEVFATPMMAALMEQAACKCLTLEAGQTSVGTELSIRHMAATPLGAAVTATALITGIDGRKVTFDVSAEDGTAQIGAGTHTRVIVDAERFMRKLGQ